MKGNSYPALANCQENSRHIELDNFKKLAQKRFKRFKQQMAKTRFKRFKQQMAQKTV